MTQDVDKIGGGEHADKLCLVGIPNRNGFDICAVLLQPVSKWMEASPRTQQSVYVCKRNRTNRSPCSTIAKNAKLIGIFTSNTTTYRQQQNHQEKTRHTIRIQPRERRTFPLFLINS